MAETLLSPGVLTRENDLSLLVNSPAPVGAAILGPTVKGQPNIPTQVTSWSDYLTKFGGSFVSGSTAEYTYFTSIAAYNYFQSGGTNLLVTRIASGSFTSATASTIAASSSGASFELQTVSYGANQNSTGTEDASGSLSNGTSTNIRWEIVNPNFSSGTFNLLVRRGDDNTNNKVVLETWTNLSLDPIAPNYISKVIGDSIFNLSSDSTYVEVTGSYPNRSNYVVVKSVNKPTPNFFDNNGIAKSAFTGSIPVAASGTFGAAVGNLNNTAADKYYDAITDGNTQGILPANYADAITLLSNADEYQYNVISAPGLSYSGANGNTQLRNLMNNTRNRADALAVIDTQLYGGTVSAANTQANSIDNSYASTYWPWLQTVDPITGALVWVPASTMIPAVYAYNDTVAAPWFAPAGINRGGLSDVVRAEKKLTQSDRDSLYQNKVNPIATFPAQGVVVYGQKTLQTQASALDRVNVRRLLIALKDRISTISKTLVFEQNTIATRNAFLSQVNPYLESVQQQQGLYAFKVVMDDSNNTPDVIDRNQLIGAIYLQPTKTAEFIYLDFNILPTGATFPA